MMVFSRAGAPALGLAPSSFRLYRVRAQRLSSTHERSGALTVIKRKTNLSATEQLGRQVALLSAVAPLLVALPAFAQLDPASTAALADSVAVPLILSSLAGGAVYAALQSKETKEVLSQIAEGVRTEEAPKELAQSSSPLVKGLEDPLEAVKHTLDNAATQLSAMTTSTEAAPFTPALAVQDGPAAPPKAKSQENAATLTQATAVRAVDADATKQVLSPGKVASQTDTQKVAASVQLAQTASFAQVPAATDNSAEMPAPEKKARRSENIFDLAVETRKRMQAEYVRKMAAMRAGTAQKQADEAKRMQQRSAAISRLHTATESQAAKERIEAARQQHPMGALSRLLALLMSVWAWLQRQLSRLTHRSSGSRSSGAAAGP